MDELDHRLLLPNAVRRWTAETPDQVFVEHRDGRTLTYASADVEARRWAAALRRAGVESGEHVAVMVADPITAAVAWLGCVAAGAVSVPLNTAHVGRMLEYVLAQSDAVCVVVDADLVDRVAAVRAAVPALRTVVVAGEPSFLDGVTPVDSIPTVTPEMVASLLYTSGTTGPSKGALVTWVSTHHFWGWVPDGTIEQGEGLYCPLPLFHNSGRGALHYVASRGGRLITRDKFSVASYWDDVRATGAVAGALVGPMTGLLYGLDERPDDDDNPLRSLIVGPMIPEIERLQQRYGVRVATCYGMTEVPAPLYTTFDHGPWATCGREQDRWPWFQVRLVDDHGNEVAPGEVGELVVRSPVDGVIAGAYYGMAQATAAAWSDGWFHTGDAMRRDADGWYYFADRLKDAIRRRGENISSFEVEAGVLEHPAVAECAAVAMPAGRDDEDVMVFVVPADGATFDPAELAPFLAGRLPAFMTPRYVEVVDELPRNTTSLRVQKHRLRERGRGPNTYDARARS